MPVFPSLWWLATPLLLALACSHDSPRDNPLDPTLTPPVELQVALDDTAGTATLTWTRYEGEAEFGEYWVLRNIDKSTEVDTVARIVEQSEVAYADTSLAPNTDYAYRVSVVNTGGLEISSPGVRTRPLSLPPVQIETVDLDSRAATARLTWTPYQGPRFGAYEVRRRTETLASETIAELPDSTATSWMDSGLVGATDYYYQVVVLTQRGEEVAGPEATGVIHRLVGSWPLDIPGEGTSADHARLYAEPEGSIGALLTNRDGVRLLRFDTAGTLVGRQSVISKRSSERDGRDAAMAVGKDGQRRLVAVGGYADRGWNWGVIALDSDGQPSWREYEPFIAAFPGSLDSLEAGIEGEIHLLSWRTGGFHGVGIFDRVQVSTGEQVLYEESFSGWPGGEMPEYWDGWSNEAGWTETELGWLTVYIPHSRPTPMARASRSDSSWLSFRLDADMVANSGLCGIQVGGDVYSRFHLGLDLVNQQVALDWFWTPPSGSVAKSREEHMVSALPLLCDAPYRLSLGAIDGKTRAVVASPVVWVEGPQREGQMFYALSAAMVDGRLIATAEERPYVFDLNGQVESLWLNPGFPTQECEYVTGS